LILYNNNQWTVQVIEDQILVTDPTGLTLIMDLLLILTPQYLKFRTRQLNFVSIMPDHDREFNQYTRAEYGVLRKSDSGQADNDGMSVSPFHTLRDPYASGSREEQCK
jgi:hypothetical protein